MFGFGGPRHSEISPVELQKLLSEGQALLVDVREPDEFSEERIAGAINMPLSGFQPSLLPDAGGKKIILQCAGGKRSGMALEKCAAAQAAINTHLAGGLAAWKAAGLPVQRG